MGPGDTRRSRSESLPHGPELIKGRTGTPRAIIHSKAEKPPWQSIKPQTQPSATRPLRDLANGGQLGDIAAAGRMTLNGTVNKTGILLLCAIATAAGPGISSCSPGDPRSRRRPDDGRHDRRLHLSPWSPSSRRSGRRSPRPSTRCSKAWCSAASPPSSSCAIPASPSRRSASPSARSSCCCFAYRSGLIKVTDKLRLGIVAATGGIAVFYLLEMVLGFFGIHFATINGSGLIGIGFSLLVVGIAALNLVSTSTSSRGRPSTARPSTWSGTAPSASWSRWSGSTSRSSACSPKSAAATKSQTGLHPDQREAHAKL